jgi:hypothetical protein
MTYDFLGTYTIDQLNDLEGFLEQKIEDLDNEANHLVMEARRVRLMKSKYESALVKLGADTDDSGILTTKRLEKVEQSPSVFVNSIVQGRIFEYASLKVPAYVPAYMDDASSAVIMEKMKRPFRNELKYQRERLEHKIRKCGDLAEQLEELRNMKLIAKDETAAMLKSLREIAAANDNRKTGFNISYTG